MGQVYNCSRFVPEEEAEVGGTSVCVTEEPAYFSGAAVNLAWQLREQKCQVFPPYSAWAAALPGWIVIPQTGSFSVVAIAGRFSTIITAMVLSPNYFSAGDHRLATLQTDEESKTYTWFDS
jgi:hypothetical protein